MFYLEPKPKLKVRGISLKKYLFIFFFSNSTAMKIIPEKVDFYFAKQGEIADRIKYTKSDGNWQKTRVAA